MDGAHANIEVQALPRYDDLVTKVSPRPATKNTPNVSSRSIDKRKRHKSYVDSRELYSAARKQATTGDPAWLKRQSASNVDMNEVVAALELRNAHARFPAVIDGAEHRASSSRSWMLTRMQQNGLAASTQSLGSAHTSSEFGSMSSVFSASNTSSSSSVTMPVTPPDRSRCNSVSSGNSDDVESEGVIDFTPALLVASNPPPAPDAVFTTSLSDSLAHAPRGSRHKDPIARARLRAKSRRKLPRVPRPPVTDDDHDTCASIGSSSSSSSGGGGGGGDMRYRRLLVGRWTHDATLNRALTVLEHHERRHQHTKFGTPSGTASGAGHAVHVPAVTDLDQEPWSADDDDGDIGGDDARGVATSAPLPAPVPLRDEETAFDGVTNHHLDQLRRLQVQQQLLLLQQAKLAEAIRGGLDGTSPPSMHAVGAAGTGWHVGTQEHDVAVGFHPPPGNYLRPPEDTTTEDMSEDFYQAPQGSTTTVLPHYMRAPSDHDDFVMATDDTDDGTHCVDPMTLADVLTRQRELQLADVERLHRAEAVHRANNSARTEAAADEMSELLKCMG